MEKLWLLEIMMEANAMSQTGGILALFQMKYACSGNKLRNNNGRRNSTNNGYLRVCAPTVVVK